MRRALLECRVIAEYEGGDHTLFLGQVIDLAYIGGRLKRIKRNCCVFCGRCLRNAQQSLKRHAKQAEAVVERYRAF